MNIGIDIDGVLTDIHGFNQKHAPPFFKRKFGHEVVDECSYDIREVFNCSDSEFKAYWKKYLLKYTIIEPPRERAKEVIHKLLDDKHNIYIISKRVFTYRQDFVGRLMRFIVRNWLRRNGIRYNEIIFCDYFVPDSKRTVCLDKHIDIMVDDDEVNILSVAPIAKVICFDTTYNRDCEGENIVRARNWGEVYQLISEG